MSVASTELHPIEARLRILIVDDHQMIRKALRTILELYPRFEVCGEAQDGAKAVEQAQKLRPDVVVLNVNMPVMNGFDAARSIKTTLPESSIVILSSDADQHLVDEAQRIGVGAYVAKTRAGDGLAGAIEAAVLAKDFVLIK